MTPKPKTPSSINIAIIIMTNQGGEGGGGGPAFNFVGYIKLVRSFLQFCDYRIVHNFMYYFLHVSWKFQEIPGHV